MANKPALAGAAAAGVPVAAALGLVFGLAASGAADAPAAPVGAALRPGSVPAAYASMIEEASGACGLDLPAAVLAAQLHQESGFNPDAVSAKGAQGIAQFTPGGWRTWGEDADGDGTADPFDPADAIAAQGRYMCALLHRASASGITSASPLALALAGYNAGWDTVARCQGIPPFPETRRYVAEILADAAGYTDDDGGPGPGGGDAQLPPGFSLPADTPPQVAAAVSWALAQRGGWYRLGGDCTDPLGTDPAQWCDCSSLVQQAYAHAGIALARTTYAQVDEGIPIDPDHPLPGDLVFVPGSDGTASRPGHVGMYIGDGLLVEAPHTGARIRVAAYRSWRDAASPAARVVAVRRIVAQ